MNHLTFSEVRMEAWLVLLNSPLAVVEDLISVDQVIAALNKKD